MLRKDFKKVLSCFFIIVFLSGLLPQSTQPAFAAGSSVLQALIDTTPPGGTLNLTGDLVGKKRSIFSEDVYITKEITIKGPSKNNPVQLDWIRLEIQADNVVLKNLRFTKGNPDYYGMFIYSEDADNLTIQNCTFDTEHNKNIDGLRTAYRGGSICVKNASNVNILNNIFRYNKVTFNGGSVYLENVDDCLVQGCMFEKNRGVSNLSIMGGGTTQGGGLYAKSSENISLSDCTFDGNYAEQYGGAAYFYDCNTVDVTECTFQENDCTPPYAAVYEAYGMGGALAFRNSYRSTVSNCDFIDNTAYSGGGIFAAKSGLTVSECDFTGNDVDQKVIVNPNLIREIIKDVYAIYTLDIQGFIEKIVNYALTEATCPGVQIDDFLEGTGAIGGEGGGLYSINTRLSVADCYFRSNDAEQSGGGLYVAGDSTAKDTQITSCVFRANHANGSGGAITNLMTGAVIADCEIRANSAGAGGGLYSVAEHEVTNTDFIYNNAVLGGGVCSNLVNNHQTYTDCLFETNEATAGGALYGHGYPADGKGRKVDPGDCQLTVSGCDFKQNTATEYGGAVYSLYNLSEIEQSTFRTNEAKLGGALYSKGIPNQKQSVTKLNKCNLVNNEAEKGGAVYNTDTAELLTSQAKYRGNTAHFRGGAFYDNSGDIKAENCLLTGNITEMYTPGSVFYLDATESCDITNCTIAGNYPAGTHTNSQMTAIYAGNGSDLKLRNNIIVSNAVIENISARDVALSNDSTLDAKYNLCALQGTGNVEGTSGVFADGGAGTDYHLRYDFINNSLGKAMEAGANRAVSENYDLDGNTRIVDNDGDGTASVDLGCYEQEYIRITFAIESEAGEIDGDTVQWIKKGGKADVSAVTVTPTAGWRFDHWESSDGTRINVTEPEHSEDPFFNPNTYTVPTGGNSETEPLYSGDTLSAVCEPIQVKVTFEYDPNKVRVASEMSGPSARSYHGNTAQFVIYADMYSPLDTPEMQGINGWEFARWNTVPPELITEETIFQAVAHPTVTYDLGDKGYYGQNREHVVVSDSFNPLFVPDKGRIKIQGPYEFIGWSSEKGGKAITLPGGITEPTSYYAVFGDIWPEIVLNNVTKVKKPNLFESTFKEAAQEGTLYEITGRIVDPCGERWRGSIDFGSPIGPEILKINPDKTFSIRHKFYDKEPLQQIKVKVWNNFGYQAKATAQVMVKNVAPLVNAGNDAVFYRGVLFKRSIVFKDPGRDQWTAEVDYGKKVIKSIPLKNKSFELSQVYQKSGTYHVSISIRDQDGGVGKDTFQLKIKDYLLTFNPGEDAMVKEGENFKREVLVIGPVEKIKSAEVNFGDSSAVPQLTPYRKLLLKHSFPDDGIYEVNIKVTDVDEDVYKVGFNVTVENAVPVVNAGNGGTIPVNQTFNSIGSFSDLGQDSWTAEVNYDDGSGWHNLTLNGNKFSLSHSYQYPGDYTVTVRVSDDDGGIGEDTCKVNVRSVSRADLSGFVAIIEDGTLNITNAKDKEGALLSGPFNVSIVCAEDPLKNCFLEDAMFGDGTMIEGLGLDPGSYTLTISIQSITNPQTVQVDF